MLDGAISYYAEARAKFAVSWEPAASGPDCQVPLNHSRTARRDSNRRKWVPWLSSTAMSPNRVVVAAHEREPFVGQIGNLRRIANPPAASARMAHQADCQSAAGYQPAPQIGRASCR